MFTPWVLERPVLLDVYGPTGTRDDDEASRGGLSRGHRHPAPRAASRRPRGTIAPTSQRSCPGLVYEDAQVRVEAIAVPHGTWPQAFAYRFRTADRTIVISGDTRPSPALADACNGCDVLVHEVYSAEKFKSRPPEWQKYHAAFHTSTVELAALATRAKPKVLVLYHQLFWGATDADLEREIRAAGFSGRVVSGRDLEVF